MYSIVWIYFVWSIAVSLYYCFDIQSLLIIAIFSWLPYCCSSIDKKELFPPFIVSIVFIVSAIVDWKYVNIYSIGISCLYLAYLVLSACDSNDQTTEGLNKKLRNEYIVKALSATTLIVTSIIVAYTTELYSLIPSGLLVVGLFIEKTRRKCAKCCKSFTSALKKTKNVPSQMSNQEQEHLFGINAL